jgi:hypothetical protein
MIVVMRGLVVMLIACAGCNPTSGVQISVEPIAGVTEVRAYVGTGNPTKIATTSPLSIPGEPKLAGNYFARDTQFDDELLAVNPGEAAQFVYTGSGTIPAFVAVGFDHGVPVAVATQFGITLPSDHFDLYDLQLAKATLPGTSSTLQLEVWDPVAATAPPHAACVGVQDTTATADTHFGSVYIVNSGDPDCDGVTGDHECPGDDLTYFGEEPLQRSARDTVQCTIESGTQCMLGGPPCIDAAATADPNLCVAAPYCAPQAVCNCATPSLDCNSSSAAANFATGIECDVGTMIDNTDPMTLDLCGGTATTDLTPALPSDAKCSDAAIYDPTMHKFVAMGTNGQIVASVTVSDDCSLSVTLSGHIAVADAAQDLANGVVVVEVDGQTGPNNGLALPLLVKNSGANCNPLQCTFQQSGGETSRLASCTGMKALGSP